jgi:hypothetical protein
MTDNISIPFMELCMNNDFQIKESIKDEDNDSNKTNKTTLLEERNDDNPNSMNVYEIVTCDRIVLFLCISIIACLIVGLIDCLNSTHNNVIVYGTIETSMILIILIYYFINIIWYTIFTLIHIFILSTRLCYSINKMEYLECIVFNYKKIYSNYIIKILFVSAIIILQFININYTNNSIQLYYNIIIIEVVLSSILYVCINKIINSYDFIHRLNKMVYTVAL